MNDPDLRAAHERAAHERAAHERAAHERAAHRRAQRRAFVRAHHPDAGGDPVTFRTGLAQFDHLSSAETTPARSDGSVATDGSVGVVAVSVYRRRRGLLAVVEDVATATARRRRRRTSPRVQ